MQHREMPDGSLAMVDPECGYRIAMGFKVEGGYACADRWNERTMADYTRLSAHVGDNGVASYGRGSHHSIPVVLRPGI